MRVVTLRTIDLVLEQRVMLRQPELGLDGSVAFETRRRVLARIDYRLASTATAKHVKAGRPVARFAPGQPDRLRCLKSYSGVRAAWENMGDIRVTLRAGLVADKVGSRDLWRRS